jgi:hypothetical protein
MDQVYIKTSNPKCRLFLKIGLLVPPMLVVLFGYLKLILNSIPVPVSREGKDLDDIFRGMLKLIVFLIEDVK